MTFYYLSFCDVERPKGEQFLGATVVEADDPKAAFERCSALGVNPGGEVAILELNVASEADLPPEGKACLNRFVPREEVIEGGAFGIDELDDIAASVCQEHNSPKVKPL